MLIIRKEQMEALAEDRGRQFERRVKEHLGKSWGDRCARMGDEELTRSIRESVERAEAHGIRSERDIVRYVDLGFVISPDFEEDPRVPWMAEILGADTDPTLRMNEIYRRLRVEGYI